MNQPTDQRPNQSSLPDQPSEEHRERRKRKVTGGASSAQPCAGSRVGDTGPVTYPKKHRKRKQCDHQRAFTCVTTTQFVQNKHVTCPDCRFMLYVCTNCYCPFVKGGNNKKHVRDCHGSKLDNDFTRRRNFQDHITG